MTEPALSPVPLALIEVEAVLDFGAIKYPNPEVNGARPTWHHLAKACKHLARYLCGERSDPETGLHPLAHCAARVLLALESILRRSSHASQV